MEILRSIAAGILDELAKHVPREQIHVSESMIDDAAVFVGSTYTVRPNCVYLLINSKVLVRIYDSVMVGIRIPWEYDDNGKVTQDGYAIKSDTPFELPNAIELIIAKVLELYQETVSATE